MRVSILTPEAEIVSEEAESVSLMTELGAIQIFPGHASLQGDVLFSPVRLVLHDREEDFVVQRGFVFIDQEKDEVRIQVYRCERKEEMDFVSAKEYLEILLSALSHPEQLGKYHLLHLENERLVTQKRIEMIQSTQERSF
ncbi:hypothetical protein KBA73_04200 [Patescibacteria group bacterium]|nr:hypothetical protein [Patescibacteria group bacterium]